jgi:hypothetical protein
MKFLFFARVKLIDCGRASKQTKGVAFAALTEGGSPPFIHFP